MDQNSHKDFSHEVRVNVKGFKKYKGYSSMVTTYCCSATPCYYVVFPAIGYDGYFERYDVQIN